MCITVRMYYQHTSTTSSPNEHGQIGQKHGRQTDSSCWTGRASTHAAGAIRSLLLQHAVVAVTAIIAVLLELLSAVGSFTPLFAVSLRT